MSLVVGRSQKIKPEMVDEIQMTQQLRVDLLD
jgi:hypothetical protein